MTGTLHIVFDARKPTPHARHWPLTVKFGPSFGDVNDRVPRTLDGYVIWPVLDERLEHYARLSAVAARLEFWSVKRTANLADVIMVEEKLRRALSKALAAGLTITVALPAGLRAESAKQERLF